MYTHLTPKELTPRQVYKLMIGCVVPRPIAWITSVDADGKGNLAPFSYFNGVSSNPAVISVSFSFHPERPEHSKDTLRNIRTTKEFVVNVVTEESAAAMHASSGEYDPSEDELDAQGLTRVASQVVRPPSLAESPIRLECRLYDSHQVGSGPGSATLVLGELVNVAVRDDLINDRLHVDHEKLHVVGRLAGTTYTYVREILDLGPRP
jgi:flavin reductase (DIM6/NTAB) family NADH-FMN oxidoreductase RutF